MHDRQHVRAGVTESSASESTSVRPTHAAAELHRLWLRATKRLLTSTGNDGSVHPAPEVSLANRQHSDASSSMS